MRLILICSIYFSFIAHAWLPPTSNYGDDPYGININNSNIEEPKPCRFTSTQSNFAKISNMFSSEKSFESYKENQELTCTCNINLKVNDRTVSKSFFYKTITTDSNRVENEKKLNDLCFNQQVSRREISSLSDKTQVQPGIYRYHKSDDIHFKSYEGTPADKEKLKVLFAQQKSKVKMNGIETKEEIHKKLRDGSETLYSSDIQNRQKMLNLHNDFIQQNRDSLALAQEKLSKIKMEEYLPSDTPAEKLRKDNKNLEAQNAKEILQGIINGNKEAIAKTEESIKDEEKKLSDIKSKHFNEISNDNYNDLSDKNKNKVSKRHDRITSAEIEFDEKSAPIKSSLAKSNELITASRTKINELELEKESLKAQLVKEETNDTEETKRNNAEKNKNTLEAIKAKQKLIDDNKIVLRDETKNANKFQSELDKLDKSRDRTVERNAKKIEKKLDKSVDNNTKEEIASTEKNEEEFLNAPSEENYIQSKKDIEETYKNNKELKLKECRASKDKDCKKQAEKFAQEQKEKDLKQLENQQTEQVVSEAKSEDNNTSGGDAELCKSNSDANFPKLAQCTTQPPPTGFVSSSQGMFSPGDLSTCREEFGNDIFSNAEFWKQFEAQPNVLCAKIQNHYCEAEKIAYLSCDEKGKNISNEICPILAGSSESLQLQDNLKNLTTSLDTLYEQRKTMCDNYDFNQPDVCTLGTDNCEEDNSPSTRKLKCEEINKKIADTQNEKNEKTSRGASQEEINSCIVECKETVFSKLEKREAPHPQFNITQSLQACINENKEKYHQEVYLPCKSAHAIAEINEYDDQAIQEAQAKAEKNSKKKNQQEEDDGETSISSFDGRFQCEKSAPYVADWKACKRMVQTYNAAFAAEQALNMTTTATQLVDQNRIQESVQESMQKGDTQTAAMEAIRRTAKGKANVETARLAFYSTQAVVLGAELAAWPTPKNVSRKCEKCPECCEYMAHELKQYKDDIFPNLNTKHAFLAEMFTVLGKAGQAGIMMAEFNRQSKLMAQIKDKFAPKPTNDPGYDMQMTLCEFNPNDPQCQGARPGGRASNFNGPGINFEFGAANNFDAQGGVIDSVNTDLGSPGSYKKDPVADSKVVPTGDLSGFKENFDAPSAVAAGFKPVDVGGAGGGGGAGGAGGGGGGGAGARKPASSNNGPTEITTNKIDGKYSMGAGGASGYSAASSSKSNGKKDDKNASGGAGNPFEKLQGRIPASRDIGRPDSNIFKKITDRYQDVLNARRVLVLE